MSKKKISSSEKIEAVEQFLRGEISQPAQARKLGINLRTFQDWIRKYQSMGTEGLLERKKKRITQPRQNNLR